MNRREEEERRKVEGEMYGPVTLVEDVSYGKEKVAIPVVNQVDNTKVRARVRVGRV